MSTSCVCGRRDSRDYASASTPTTRSRCCRSGSTSTTTPAGRRSHTKYFFIIVEDILFRRPVQLCVVLQVEQYTRLLNSAGCRAGRPKLDPHNIVYWFKNTRAALRRAETRLGGEVARSAWGFMVHSVSLDSNCPKNTDSSEEYSPIHVC